MAIKKASKDKPKTKEKPLHIKGTFDEVFSILAQPIKEPKSVTSKK